MLKQFVSQLLAGSRLYAPIRHAYRRFSSRRKLCTHNESQLYSAFVRPGDLVFDIGANLGYKTEVFLECGARVICVEPNPLCHAILEYEFAKNPRVTLVKMAVGAEQGSLPMYVKGTATTSTMLDDWAPFAAFDGSVQRIDVPVTTLDALIRNYGKPDFIKIDIEGFELPALIGLSSPVPFLTFEYAVSGKGSERLVQCLKQLEALGRPIDVNAIFDQPDDERRLAFAWPDAVPIETLEVSDMPEGCDCFVALR